MRPSLLIVDDEESVRDSFRLALQGDYDLVLAEDGRAALQALKSKRFDLCLLDILLPDGSGLDLLRQAKRKDETLDVVMVTALSGAETALRALKDHAYDYITKPFQIAELRALIQKLLDRKALRARTRGGADLQPFCLTGNGKSLKSLLKRVEAASQNDDPLWLMVEKGSGVEDIAREIHQKSQRWEGPFVTYSCSARSKERMLVELFGEEVQGQLPQIGKLEFANGGTLFLQGVDKLPLSIQEKLLEALSEQLMSRSKSKDLIPVNVRLIASSGIDLNLQAAEKIFLKKFYRFMTRSVISVPPISEREMDIPELLRRIVKETNERAKVPVKHIDKEVAQLIAQYPWSNHLDELQNTVETMVLFAGKETLTLDDVPLDILLHQIQEGKFKKEMKLSLKQLQYQFEHQFIRKVLENTEGNQTQAAKVLGLHRNTLIGKLKKLNLENYYRDLVRQRRERKAALEPG